MSSNWIIAIALLLAVFILNGFFAHRYRSRQLRELGKEPPPFLKFLFFPKPLNAVRVQIPRPIRIAIGIVVALGGVAFVLIGYMLIVFPQAPLHATPIGALIGIFVALTGLLIGFVGYRLIRIRYNDEPLFQPRHIDK